MAYIFPVNPYDGQLYPLPAVPGALQYQWNSSLRCWLIYSPLGVQSVTGLLPIIVTNGTSDAVVSIRPATINTDGSMTAADKAKLDAIPDNVGTGTVTQVNTGAGLTGGPITSLGTIAVTPANSANLGGVIIGNNIDVAANGTISIPNARFGVTSLNVGPGLIGSPSPITGPGTISAALATRLSIGSVRVGNGLNVALDGTLSVGGSLGDVGVLAWATVGVSNTAPYNFTVLEGYNISSILWQAGPQPRAVVYFQRPLQNSNYGVFLTSRCSTYGASSELFQDNAVINFNFKTVTNVSLSCLVSSTLDNTTTVPSTANWNAWNKVVEFDIMIVDTAVY